MFSLKGTKIDQWGESRYGTKQKSDHQCDGRILLYISVKLLKDRYELRAVFVLFLSIPIYDPIHVVPEFEGDELGECRGNIIRA